MRDSALTLTFAHDPTIAPEGELRGDISVADVMIQHGADMLANADDHSTLMRMPAPCRMFVDEMTAADEGLTGAMSSDAGPTMSPRSRQSHTEAHMHLESDVCLSISAVHWLDMTGSPALSTPARAQVHLQVRHCHCCFNRLICPSTYRELDTR